MARFWKWTPERVDYAWERLAWHDTAASCAAELELEWDCTVTAPALLQAVRKGGYENLRAQVGSAIERQRREERQARSRIAGSSPERERSETSAVSPAVKQNGTGLSQDSPDEDDVLRILVIPDTQVDRGSSIEHARWIARYAVAKRPQEIWHLGDHWNFDALSRHVSDVEKAFDRSTYQGCVDRGNEWMADFRDELGKTQGYEPTLRFFLGNHDNFVSRELRKLPWLVGSMSTDDLDLNGWTVYPFLEVVELYGIWVSHYFYKNNKWRAIGGTPDHYLKEVGRSCVAGHTPSLGGAMRDMKDGTRQRCLRAGSCYLEKLDYRGPQSSGEWCGIVMLNDVKDGWWDQCDISLDFLRRKYG